MDLAQKQDQRITHALTEWANRNGLSLTHEATRQLKELIHNQVDIHRSEALSLAHEALPGRSVFATREFKEHQARGNTLANFIRGSGRKDVY